MSIAPMVRRGARVEAVACDVGRGDLGQCGLVLSGALIR